MIWARLECRQAWRRESTDSSECRSAGGIVEIAVHNEGRPIPPEDLRALFESFKQASNVGSEAKGWGLGLNLVRGVADAHGGTVSVESSEDRGTTFTLRLPIDCRAAR
ncbi:MAG: sensor histidine kinase [Candidatus Acidiferrales bacterium]